MKRVDDACGLAAAWTLESSEAASSFGDGTVLIERFVLDCLGQYRCQEMLEEAPCSALPTATRERLHTQALRIADALDYVSLCTVEFLCDVARNEHHDGAGQPDHAGGQSTAIQVPKTKCLAE